MAVAILSETELDLVNGGGGPSIIFINPIHITQLNLQRNVGSQFAALNHHTSQSLSQTNVGANIISGIII
jgi:hypothetical protein